MNILASQFLYFQANICEQMSNVNKGDINHTKSYYNTSIKSQFILSSFLRVCASDDGEAAGCPRQARLVFCFFGQGSSKVKSSSSTCSSFFNLNPESDDPSLEHLSVCMASETIKDTLYKETEKCMSD